MAQQHAVPHAAVKLAAPPEGLAEEHPEVEPIPWKTGRVGVVASLDGVASTATPTPTATATLTATATATSTATATATPTPTATATPTTTSTTTTTSTSTSTSTGGPKAKKASSFPALAFLLGGSPSC